MNEKPSLVRIARRTILAVLAVGIIILIVVQNRPANTSRLPVYGTVPNFSLTAEDERIVTRADLEGYILVVDFIFTHCAGSCPMMSSRMTTIQSAVTHDPAVRLVSITVDPERDTPGVLQRYANTYGAQQGKWLFVTGKKLTIYQLARNGFRLGVAEKGGPPDEPIIHSSRFVLVDRQSRIRGYYDGTDDDAVQQLIADIKTLLAEQP